MMSYRPDLVRVNPRTRCDQGEFTDRGSLALQEFAEAIRQRWTRERRAGAGGNAGYGDCGYREVETSSQAIAPPTFNNAAVDR